jgi:hypothetical protein
MIVEKRRTGAHYQRTRLLSHKQNYNRLSNSLKNISLNIRTQFSFVL